MGTQQMQTGMGPAQMETGMGMGPAQIQHDMGMGQGTGRVGGGQPTLQEEVPTQVFHFKVHYLVQILPQPPA